MAEAALAAVAIVQMVVIYRLATRDLPQAAAGPAPVKHTNAAKAALTKVEKQTIL